MTTPSGPYDPNSPQNPPPYSPYPPYPPYPPTYPGAAPEQPYGPPPYGAPPYGQPYGAPPMYPPYPPSPPPQSNSHKTLWIILGVVGGVLLLSCVACVGIVYFAGRQFANSPILGSTIAVSEFCTDEEQQDYVSAYNQFSTQLQGQISQDQFVSRGQQLDSTNGPVSHCTPSVSTTGAAPSSSSATFDVTVERSTSTGTQPTTATGTITLVNSDGSWKIDAIDSALGLT